MAYNPAICDLIQDAAETGKLGCCTVRDLTTLLGVHYRQLYTWMSDHAEFHQTIIHARHHADAVVESALYKRAKGLTISEDKPFLDRKTGAIITAKARKELPPDTDAALAWLYNRQPDRWRNKIETSSETTITVRRDPAELAMLRQIAIDYQRHVLDAAPRDASAKSIEDEAIDMAGQVVDITKDR